MSSSDDNYGDDWGDNNSLPHKKEPNWGVLLAAVAIIISTSALLYNVLSGKALKPNDVALMVYKVDLHNVQYKNAGVITIQKDLFNLFGWTPIQLEKITFAYVGYVESGFDLQQITEQDIQISKRNTIIFTLPPVKIYDPVIDDEQSDWDHQVLMGFQPTAEMEQKVRVMARDELLKKALDAGLLTDAKNNARAFFQSFFNNLGFTLVEIRFR